MNELLKLSDRDIQEIASALRSGRLSLPFSSVAVQRIVAGNSAPGLAADLQRFAENAFTADQIASTLEFLWTDRSQRPRIEDVIQLVTTGPEIDGIANRDTSVVV